MRNPLNHVELDHNRLWASAQRELLQSTKGALAQVSIAIFLVKHLDQHFDKVWLLEQIATAKALARQGIYESHGVLEHLPWSRKKSVYQNSSLLLLTNLLSSLSTVKQVVVLVGVDHKFYKFLPFSFVETPA